MDIETATDGHFLAGAAGDRAEFSRNWNLRSFRFAHTLNRSGLFSIENLIAFAQRFPDGHFWSNEEGDVGDGWQSRKRLSLPETLARIDEGQSLCVLKHVERDPDIGPGLERIIQQVLACASPQQRADVTHTRATLLVASPWRITNYHIDADLNYLFQIAGAKRISVFSHIDRELVTHEELERFYVGDLDSVPYRDVFQPSAVEYRLDGGDGIHIPVAAPHWAKNGDNVSIALSINFNLHSVRKLSRIYRANRLLRKLGVQPAPPSEPMALARDRIKLASVNAALKTGLLKPGPHWQ